jgi:hypothetical protein
LLRPVCEAALQVGVAELPQRAGLPQDSPLVGIGEEPHRIDGLAALRGQPDPGETQPSPRRAERRSTPPRRGERTEPNETPYARNVPYVSLRPRPRTAGLRPAGPLRDRLAVRNRQARKPARIAVGGHQHQVSPSAATDLPAAATTRRVQAEGAETRPSATEPVFGATRRATPGRAFRGPD